MAVGVGRRGANGPRAVIVGTSEPRGYLRPGVTVEADEIVAEGCGHAECNVIDRAVTEGVQLEAVGAGRPICPTCAERINESGAQPATPLREPRKGSSE
jgi:filamentous hemagglutinin